MYLYTINPNEPFLEKLSNFIIDHFFIKPEKIPNLKIILPNIFECIKLQKILVNKLKITLLPDIIPINIFISSEHNLNLSLENLVPLTILEEEIIFATIINNYKNITFNIKQSFKCSSEIRKLFYQLKNFNVSLEEVHKINKDHSSCHWQKNYDLLQYIYIEWSKTLIESKLINRLEYEDALIASEVLRLKNRDNNLIIAGILDNNLIKKLIKHIKTRNFFWIIPYTKELHNKILFNKKLKKQDTDSLLFIRNCLSSWKIKPSKIQSLTSFSKSNNPLINLILDNELENYTYQNNSYQSTLNTSVVYYEFDNFFEEAKKIVSLCIERKKATIAIIINNSEIKDILYKTLEKYSLKYTDLLGCKLSTSLIYNLFFNIITLLCNDFDIEKLLLVLKHPLIYSNFVQLLESLIKKNAILITNIEELRLIILNSNDKKLINWTNNMLNLLYQKNDNNVILILKHSIQVAENLYPKIWQHEGAYELSNFLYQLINNDLISKIKDIILFPEIIKILILDKNFFRKENISTKIVIGKIDDLYLSKFDTIILADFNSNVWCKNTIENPWISNKTLETLGVITNKIQESVLQYRLFLIMHNKNIVITRSKNQNGNTNILPSNFLLKLEWIFKDKIIKKSQKFDNYNDIKLENHSSIKSPVFPNILSATSINTLMKNPYIFYAKNILNLKPEQQCNIIGITDFGKCVHKILEIYTKKYNSLNQKKLDSIITISSKIIDSLIIPKYIKRIWKIKFYPIANTFIEFDEARREKYSTILSEYPGEYNFKIQKENIKITAIADRIEIDKDYNACIIDYKTGALPTKQEVLYGLTPQLLIEAIILKQGGFGIKIQNIKQIGYVKFFHFKPYVEIMSIDINEHDIARHYKGLIDFISYYRREKKFLTNINLMHNIHYTHLSRNP